MIDFLTRTQISQRSFFSKKRSQKREKSRCKWYKQRIQKWTKKKTSEKRRANVDYELFFKSFSIINKTKIWNKIFTFLTFRDVIAKNQRKIFEKKISKSKRFSKFNNVRKENQIQKHIYYCLFIINSNYY